VERSASILVFRWPHCFEIWFWARIFCVQCCSISCRVVSQRGFVSTSLEGVCLQQNCKPVELWQPPAQLDVYFSGCINILIWIQRILSSAETVQTVTFSPVYRYCKTNHTCFGKIKILNIVLLSEFIFAEAQHFKFTQWLTLSTLDSVTNRCFSSLSKN